MKFVPSLALALLAVTAGGRAGDIPSLAFKVTPPAVIMDMDAHTLKGAPVKLAWSAAPGEFYLQTAEGYEPDVVLRHYVLTLGEKAPTAVAVEPVWASQYWTWKSTRNAPADPDLLIVVEEHVDANRLPTQSLADKARGMEAGGGAIALRGAEEVANDRKNAPRIKTLTLNGTQIGRFVDAPLIPGLTFGWSPAGLHAVAYVNESGRLGVFDYLLKQRQEVGGTRGVLLPAWSVDGTQIAFLSKTGKKRYSLERITITRP
jgi:hypothetical protein